MPFIVSVDGVNGRRGLVQRREAEQALSRRQHVAEARVLRDDGPPRGEIRGAAIAEPAAAQPDVLVLGDREFGARAADVLAIDIEVAGDFRGVTNLPSVLLEHATVLVVATGQGE